VLDGVLPAVGVRRVHKQAQALHAAGRFAAANGGRKSKFTDTSARSDAILWLHEDDPSTSPALSTALASVNEVRGCGEQRSIGAHIRRRC